MLVDATLRFLAFAAGAVLHLSLAILVFRKPGFGRLERLLLAVISSAGLWHGGNVLAFFIRLNTGAESGPVLNFLDNAAQLGLALTPAFLIHLSLVWSGRNTRFAAAAYLLPPVALWTLAAGRLDVYHLMLGAGLAAASVLSLWASRRETGSPGRNFFLWIGIALLVSLIGMFVGQGSALTAWASLAPPLCFAYFVYRYDYFGLLLSRQLVFVVLLGTFSALYLFLVRRAADFAADAFDFLGPLTEVALIFAAALIWLPLYAWMNRFVSKRAQIYADFSKRMIEEAARILDLEKRVQFLADEVGRTFELRRALLVTSGEPRVVGRYGENGVGIDPTVLDTLESLARSEPAELFHTYRSTSPELRRMLTDCGFNYMFPLSYEGHPTGLLLLDTSPRIYLDQDEPILLGLCRQISHSIETCRVVEQKIALEQTLLEQEHLTRLGKAAATIAHEVKNPLSSIKTLAQLMSEDDMVRERYSRDLSYMIGEVDRLNASVQQLLTFSRPAPETRTDIDLTALLETAVGALGRQQASNGVRVEHRRGSPLRLRASKPELIQQIVLNLVLNAVQASQPGGSVVVEAEARDGDRVAIVVCDEGPGIPDELRERVFEPFYTTKQKGTGLGLAIVQKNVRQLDGEIEIESPVAADRGTRVTVVLPAHEKYRDSA